MTRAMVQFLPKDWLSESNWSIKKQFALAEMEQKFLG